MSSRRLAFVGLAILFVLAFAMLAGSATELNSTSRDKASVSLLSSTASPYSENLRVYLTSNEAYWNANLFGGNISLGSGFVLPAGVNGFSLVLTHYDNWSSTFETFTKYGLSLLGPNEPMPNATLLIVDTTSSTAAASLASTLSQKFALVLTPYSSNATSFTFLSPMDFVTEMHVYFWKLLPASAGGFASMMSEASYESLDLDTFTLSDTSSGYSISYGGLTPVTSTTFSLFDLLGLTALNYSSASSSSSVQVHVLGGVSTDVNSSFANTFANFSAFASASYKGGANRAVPNLNASLDFSFPVIAAYRQVSNLVPGRNQSSSVSILVKDISPSGSPPANVTLNDDWIKTLYPTDFNVTRGNTTGTFSNMTSGQTNLVAYVFTVANSTSGSFPIPATPVIYSFKVANKTLTERTFLNSEILAVGISNQPELEMTENLPVIVPTQALSVNVTVINRGDGVAFSLSSNNGQKLSSLAPGSTWSYNVTQSSPSLTSVNASITSSVSWFNVNSTLFTVASNGVNAIYGFANPGSPSTSISKTISVNANKSQLNVTLTVSNTGSNSIKNISILDSVPAGLTFSKSARNSTIFNTGALVYTNITSLSPSSSKNFTYILNITSPYQNYVFMPANVSAAWNNVTVVHFSQGFGLPMGVVATKLISPSFGFQGSNVTERLSITNKGNLSVFEVSLSNNSDPFISTVQTSGSTVPILNTGQSSNSTIKGFFTAAPGNYNTSAAAASFIFAGSNQTASTNTYKVIIFQPINSALYTNSSRIEESHAIQIVLRVSNPSNVTVSNIKYALTLPPYLTLTQGSLTGKIASLAPEQNATASIVVETNLPNQYNIPGGNLTFQYGGQTLKGQTSGLGINIVDDLATRYGIPVVIGLIIVAATLIYVRRLSKTKT